MISDLARIVHTFSSRAAASGPLARRPKRFRVGLSGLILSDSEREANAASGPCRQAQWKRYQISGLVVAAPIPFLPGFNREGQPVLPRRDRAGRKRSEGTRRIVGVVKINHQASVRTGFGGVQKASGPVSGFSRGGVAEEDEKVVRLQIFEGGEPLFVAVDRENHRPRRGFVTNPAGHLLDGQHVGVGSGFPVAIDTPARVMGKIVQPLEMTAGGRVRIPHLY